MKARIVSILLLVPLSALGQKFQDVSKTGSPLSLSIGFYPGDPNPYVFALNNSSKGVLAIVAVANFKDTAGQSYPTTTAQDYAFKLGVLKSHDKRPVAPVDIDPIGGIEIIKGAEGTSVQGTVTDVGRPHTKKNKEAVGNGAVLFVQFEDGTTWGDSGDPFAKRLLDTRLQRLAFLKRLVETYYESGETEFQAVLNEPKPMSPEFSTAMCLKGDAEEEKTTTIDLAKKRLADAQGWHAQGIF